MQLPFVVEDGVSIKAQVAERVTVYAIHAAFPTDGWSVDVLP